MGEGQEEQGILGCRMFGDAVAEQTRRVEMECYRSVEMMERVEKDKAEKEEEEGKEGVGEREEDDRKERMGEVMEEWRIQDETKD